MKIIFLFFLIIMLQFIIGCTEQSTSPEDVFSVEGIVLSKSNPVEGALVTIESEPNLDTTTDNQGKFKLLNVPKGNHNLIITKSNADGSFSERTTAITVESDVLLDNIILPQGVQLFSLQNITDKSAKLIWSATDATDFREYKIYSHTSSGLDETTGLLIHVSTAFDDTVFNVSGLNPLTEYFFRVYVMNDYGRLGGSNIISGTTMNFQIIKNGSFEILGNNGYPENWNAENFGTLWLVDSTVVQDGKYSLSVHDQAGVIMPWQSINPSYLVADSRYRLTYWVKHEALQSSNYLEEFAIFMDNTEFTWHIEINKVSGPVLESDWEEYTFEFTMPSVTASNFNIRLYFLLAPDTYAWIDNISLEKVL